MSTKKYYMVLDTETVSTARIPFDIAYTIIDRKGNVVEKKRFLVADLFNTPMGQHLLVHDDFSKNKISRYLSMINNGVSPTYFSTIREEIRSTVKRYNCIVCAYNAQFDYECLTNFAQSLGFKNFFKSSTIIWDLWNVAVSLLVNSRNYVKFCLENGFYNEKGNLKTSAEVVYRYITKNTDFVEKHTALEDTEIEAEILATCLKRHQKLNTDFMGQVFRHPVWKTRCRAQTPFSKPHLTKVRWGLLCAGADCAENVKTKILIDFYLAML